MAPTGLPTVVPVIALRAWFRLGTKASTQSRLVITSHHHTHFLAASIIFFIFFIKNDSLSEIGCIGQASDGSSAMACGVPLGYRRRGDEGETLGESERKREK